MTHKLDQTTDECKHGVPYTTFCQDCYNNAYIPLSYETFKIAAQYTSSHCLQCLNRFNTEDLIMGVCARCYPRWEQR
jgi:hypothetical protein